MAIRTVGAGSVFRLLSPSRHNTPIRVGRPREKSSRVTDPRLIFLARKANGFVKRAIDVAGALFGLIFLSPFILTVALLVRMQDGGPILYAHPRVGRHGRIFRCLKFRTMIHDNEGILNKYLADNPAAAEEWRLHHKLTNDPRITWLGRFLRKSSLDELPQFWNVLMGEMSLVGPRPITRVELDRYAKARRFYLLVRPGITGLWQVTGRSDSSYESRIKLDREYLENWSFRRDIWILVMTIPAVLAAKGAV